MTTEQAAHLLSISANALRIMAHRGQIQVYKFGRRLRFKADDCLTLIQKKGANNGN
ncbi:MAG: helix-turn-helix domain-containing protein [Bacteriovoracaceae bacterium]